jgi:hypothetical protein
MSKSKYTKERLATIVQESLSLAQVIKALGLRLTGGNYTYIAKRIEQLGLDRTHFLGRGANHGERHRGGPEKKHWSEILVLSEPSGYRQKAVVLRRALIESGRPYECEGCGCKDEWLGCPLRLHIDHKNGEWWDSRPDNIGFLCPNCHSQTFTFGKNLGLTDLMSTARYHRAVRKRSKHESKS